MKLKVMKRSIAVLAAAFTAVSTSALAENTAPKAAEPVVSNAVQLSDAELDGVTAGAGFIIVAISNPSRGRVIDRMDLARGWLCINCAAIKEASGSYTQTWGLVHVWKSGTSPMTGDQPAFMHNIGRPPSF